MITVVTVGAGGVAAVGAGINNSFNVNVVVAVRGGVVFDGRVVGGVAVLCCCWWCNHQQDNDIATTATATTTELLVIFVSATADVREPIGGKSH